MLTSAASEPKFRGSGSQQVKKIDCNDRPSVQEDFAVLRKWILEAQDREYSFKKESEYLRAHTEELAALKEAHAECQRNIDHLTRENNSLKNKINAIEKSRFYRLGKAIRKVRSINDVKIILKKIILTRFNR